LRDDKNDELAGVGLKKTLAASRLKDLGLVRVFGFCVDASKM